MIRTFRALVFVALLSPLIAFAQAPAAAADGPPPAELFFKLPAYSAVRLSPDGRTMAALIPINGRRNLAIVDLEKRTARAVTAEKDADVLSYEWLGNRVVAVETGDLEQTGGVTARLQHDVIDVVDNNVIRDLRTVSKYGFARILTVLDKDGYDLVIETFDRGMYTTDSGNKRLYSARSPDAYHFNARTGQKSLLTLESPGDVERFVADRRGQVRVAISSPRGTERTVVSYRRSNDDKWTTLRDEPSADATLDPVAFDFDDRTLYVRVPNKVHSGRADLYAFDTETGQMGARIFEAKNVDAGSAVADYVQRKVVGVRDGSADGVDWIDPAWRQVQKLVDESLPNARNRISWARDNTDRVIVQTESDSVPPKFYLLDRKTMVMEPVGKAYPWLAEADLSPRRFVRYVARDGLSIPGYLTLPRHPDGARPPLIVNIHGGPFVQSAGFGYDAEAQYFASRGYAVLEPDFRGTIGYGAAFEQAGWRQWGLAMQDDVTDGVKWLIETGKVDADRVCLYGASYGGYATLWGLEKEPTMFRCGIAFLAVSDLELMFDARWSDFMSYEQYGGATRYLTTRLGDPSKDREQLRAVSPVNHADRIQAPLLLAYGATDERVPLIHGNEMKAALDKAHKPYEWVVYGDQKHMRFDPINGADFYRRVDAFLATNLKPRAKVASVSGGQP